MANPTKTNEQYLEFYDASHNLVNVVSLDFLNNLKELQKMFQKELNDMLDWAYDYQSQYEIDWEYY